MATTSVSALAGWTTYALPSGIDYSFVAFGDMQSITWTDNLQGTTYVKSAFDWILANKDSRKISYVFGLGDSIDTLTTYSTNKVASNGKTQNVNEWILVSTQFHRLDGIIPYTVTRGNHDDEGGYHKYIWTEDYANQMTGYYYDPSKPATLGNSKSNSYRKITIGGVKYLMLSLDYNAGDDVMAWANNVISKNPSYRVIATVHAYLNGTNSGGTGALVSSNSYFLKGDIGAANADNSEQVNTAFDGKKLWTNVFSKHSNMFMVLCGHDAIPTPVHNVRTGNNGNKVIEILTDTSKYDLEMGGNNYGANLMMVLNFKESTNQLYIEYFSPSRKAEGKTSCHLSGEQITLTYSDITDTGRDDDSDITPATTTTKPTTTTTKPATTTTKPATTTTKPATTTTTGTTTAPSTATGTEALTTAESTSELITSELETTATTATTAADTNGCDASLSLAAIAIIPAIAGVTVLKKRRKEE